MSATAGFDVRAYLRDPHALRPADLDPDTLRGLAPETLDVLAHLWCVERGQLDRLRDILVTPTHAESRVTAFLTTWAYEQHWLAESLGAILAAHGRTPREPAGTAGGRLWRTWDERARPALGAVASNLLGADLTGGQMATGGLDTAVLAAVYRRLGAAEPRLAGTAQEIVRLKERHLAFFAEEAGARLAGSASARRLARSGSARWRWPGTRYCAPGPAGAWVRRLFADPAARADLLRLDEDLAVLPGLAGARPVAAALGRLDRACGAGRGPGRRPQAEQQSAISSGESRRRPT
ncbi:hypothetical protein ACH9D2_03155 [Kocuria sp. M4R2S49]|uniref:hypothetical protein n=1 Tax=Kocuria rhizosphaericola TaxID=3376284 RepID=UPI0037B64C08